MIRNSLFKTKREASNAEGFSSRTPNFMNPSDLNVLNLHSEDHFNIKGEHQN